MSARNSAFWIVACVITLFIFAAYPRVKTGSSCYLYQRNNPFKKDVTLNFPDRKIQAEIAADNASRTKGLSGRACMRQDQAMVFVFDKDDASNHCFWMKDMQFPVDIYWLNDKKKVVYQATGVKPESYPKEYCPGVMSRYVVELASGVGKDLLTDYNDIFTFSF